MAADDLNVTREDSGNSPIRVVHFVPGSPDHDNEMIFVKRQVASLKNVGIDVSYVYFENRRSLGGFRAACAALAHAIRVESPDIVHAHYGTVTALVAAVTKKTPLIITFRGSDVNPDPTISPAVSFIKNAISQISSIRADRVIVVSETLLRKLWWKKKVASVIPSGVDFSLFHPEDILAARRRLRWSVEEPVVLFNASKTPGNKRLDLAEKAVQLVQSSVPGTRLKVLAADVAPNDIPTLMCASDCLLMLSDYEGSPNIVKEAMACNLPVISFDVGDVKKIIEDVQECTLVERDMEELVAALQRTLQARRRSNGRGRVRDLSSTNVAKRIAELYRRVARGSA